MRVFPIEDEIAKACDMLPISEMQREIDILTESIDKLIGALGHECVFCQLTTFLKQHCENCMITGTCQDYLQTRNRLLHIVMDSRKMLKSYLEQRKKKLEERTRGGLEYANAQSQRPK